MVAVGDTVELVGERNPETAQLFGGTPQPAAPIQQPVLSAQAETLAAAAPVTAPQTAAPATTRTATATVSEPAATAAELPTAMAISANRMR
jgi:hypothetical protein